MKIDGYTRLAAVVAHPIKHSLSPFIHNLAFDRTDENGVYVAWEIEEKDLQSTLNNILIYDMYGINLSMPYKQAVLPFLDELTPAASLIGAVNTVLPKEGRLIGHNTDGKGFFASLAPFDIKGKSMLILGSGGAATAIICQALLDGVQEIFVFDKAHHVASTVERMQVLSDQMDIPIQVDSMENQQSLQTALDKVELLIQATSIGMDGHSMPLSREVQLSKDLLVADLIYHPIETPFLAFCRQQGCHAINGLGMLLHQAAEAFYLWTGKRMPTDEIGELLLQEMERRHDD